MAASEPSRNDIQAIFKRLRSNPTNKQCFDCGSINPTWASVTYGVFLCIDCSATHRSLGVHLTFIRSTQLDTSWTWTQLRAMQVGGNANAVAFFRQHGCTTSDSQQKYKSRAASMYREKLLSLALKATKQYGSKVHVDSHAESTSPSVKEVDFFKDNIEGSMLIGTPNAPDSSSQPTSENTTQPIAISNGNLKQQTLAENSAGDNAEPNVEAALSMSPTTAQSQQTRKPTIGGRKPQSAKKSGLGGGRKGGIGAQKVKASFDEIQSAALRKDEEQERMASNLALQAAQEKENEEKKLVSMKLAYQDLSIQKKKQEEKMKNMDPRKAAQAERLGMGGFGGNREASHSAFSGMKTIEQESPSDSYRSSHSYNHRSRDDDDFELVSDSGFFSSNGPPKYESPFDLKPENRYSSWSNKGKDWDSDSTKDSESYKIPSKKQDDDKGRARKNHEVSNSEEAQKKYGNAKSISSDMFFNKNEPDFETKQSLSKFSGSSSISSSEFFGNGPDPNGRARGGRSSSYYSNTDLSDIKDGVRQGVTKVAGKLSSLANGVMSSIQDNYG